MNPQPPLLGIIIPCYNEEKIISQSINILDDLLCRLIRESRINSGSFIAIIDDRSKDGSWNKISEVTGKKSNLHAIRLSANRGHQTALIAGLNEYGQKADCLITMDADLQDDLSVIALMLDRFKEGHDIVFGVRNNREVDNVFKRITAGTFYRLMRVMGTEIILHHADFRLTSKRVNGELRQFREVNLFLRGIFPYMGFNTSIVHYERKERSGGSTKYSFKKMLSLALDGITSFSAFPLRLITYIGLIVFIICLFLMGYALWSYLTHRTIAGWFSTVLPFYFLGGIQILCIGIIGEYLGKIYKEVKRRPPYFIDEQI